MSAASCGLVGAARATPVERPLAQRLLVLREAEFVGGSVLMDERGHVLASLNILPGLNGGVSIERTGTRFAYVQTANLELPSGIPKRFRRRFAHLPQATLQVGTFLRDVQSSSAGSFAITFGGPQIEVKPFRPSWSPSGRSVVFSGARRGTSTSSSSLRRGRHRVRSRTVPEGTSIRFGRATRGASCSSAMRRGGRTCTRCSRTGAICDGLRT